MEFSIERFISLFFNKLKYFLLVSFVVSVGTYFISNNFIEKKYVSQSAIMIQINSQSNQNTNNELAVTKQSVENYIRTLYTNNYFKFATEKINSTLGSNYNYKQIKNNCSIKAGSSNKITSDFIISFTASTPELAQKILFIITDEAIVYLQSKNVSNPVDIIEDPNLPDHHSFPKTKSSTIYAFLFSFLFLTCFFFFREIFDDRIKCKKDVISEYNLPILGVIPDYVESKKAKRKTDSYVNSYSKE